MWENAGSVLVAIGKPRLNTMVILGQVVILAVGGLPLTLVWGAVGTCIAVGIAFTVGIVLMYRPLIRGLAVDVASIFGIPAAIGVVVLLGYAMLSYTTALNDLSLVLRLAIKVAYTLSVFYGLVAVLQPRMVATRVSYFWGTLQGREVRTR